MTATRLLARLLLIPLALLLLLPLAMQSAEAGLDGAPTALDQRRIDSLAIPDADLRLGAEDPNYPTPNLALREDWRPEHDFLKKVIAIFGRIEAGDTPDNRKAEANKLLRYSFGRWPAANRGALVGQYAAAWPHASKMMALRIYMLFKDWLDPDIKAEFERRFNLMVGVPQTSSSENIKMNNNQGIFLSHEITGRTGEASFADVKSYLVNHLRKLGRDGHFEWGTTYNQWTIAAVLNLAEFAEDAQVRRLAEMNVDYWLACQSGFRVKGRFCSPGVRRYDHWLLANYAPQSTCIRILFTGNELGGHFPEWAVSNYRPLRNVHDLNTRTAESESHLSTDKYEYRCFRRGNYGIATSQNLVDNFYGVNETHNIVAAYCTSAAHPENKVVAYGLNPGNYVKYRSKVDKSFGYRNIAFYNGGGDLKKAWSAGTYANIPIRLFYSKAFANVVIQGGWAFVTDGTIYVAWAPAVGNPIIDPQSAEFSDPNKVGRWLKSDHVPGSEGEACVLECGDAGEYGTYANFRAEILARAPRPRWQNGFVEWTARDGKVVRFGSNFATVDGVAWEADKYPRAQMPGVNSYTVDWGGRQTSFNFNNDTVSGNTERVASNLTFGDTVPPPPPPPTWTGTLVDAVYPDTVTAGDVFQATVMFTNTGTGTWTAADVAFRVAAPIGRTSDFEHASWSNNVVASQSEGSVGPGETGTFAFTLVAPEVGTATAYGEAFRLRYEPDTAWIAGIVTLDITVNPRWSGEVVRVEAPTAMESGEMATVTLVYRNTGSATWNPASSGVFVAPYPTPGVFHDPATWVNATQPAWLELPVGPGEEATITFSIIAPDVNEATTIEEQVGAGDFDAFVWFAPAPVRLSIEVSPPGAGGNGGSGASGGCAADARGDHRGEIVAALALLLIVLVAFRRRE